MAQSEEFQIPLHNFLISPRCYHKLVKWSFTPSDTKSYIILTLPNKLNFTHTTAPQGIYFTKCIHCACAGKKDYADNIPTDCFMPWLHFLSAGCRGLRQKRRWDYQSEGSGLHGCRGSGCAGRTSHAD